MNRALRILRHRLHDERDVSRLLPPAALARIEARIAESERRHAGQLRVCVEAGLPLSYLWRRLAPRDRALTLFGKLRIWDTEANNGVLIYLLVAEHAIEIVADRGVARRVPAAHWQGVVSGMREAFRAGRHEEGVMQAIAAVDAVLTKHFPLADGDKAVNELPDRVVVL